MMKTPRSFMVALLLGALGCTGTTTAAIEVTEDDVLSRLLRRPAGSGWVTGDDGSPLWLRGVDRPWPLGVFGRVRRAPATDRLDLTRTTIGVATTGDFMGRPDDRFGLTATLATESESPRFPESLAEEEEIALGLHHGWRIGSDARLRSSFGWRTGPELREPVVWGGIGIQLNF